MVKNERLQAQQEEFERQLFPGANKNQKVKVQNKPRPRTQRKRDIIKDRTAQLQHQGRALGHTGERSMNARQTPTIREKKLSSLYDSRESHPVIEYLPSNEDEDSESVTLTPSFVLEVTWPRIIQFYHPLSPICQKMQSIYVAVARGIRRRSSRLPVEFHAVNCGIYRDMCQEGFSIKSVPTIIGLGSGKIEGIEISFQGSIDDSSGSKAERAKDIELKVEYIAQMMGIPLDIVNKGHAGAAFARPMGFDGHSAVESFEENSLPGSNVKVDGNIAESEQVFHDAQSSFLSTLISSLYSQLPPVSALPTDRSGTLSEFLDLIRWAFPPETEVHDLAEGLKMEFSRISSSQDGLLEVIGRHIDLGIDIAWSSRCGVQSKGGYSCGLWSLLHILSIGVAERHTSVVGDDERVSAVHAGQVMRAFIGNFFIGCDSCRNSWIELYDESYAAYHSKISGALGESIQDDADPWRSLAIRIWEIHNEVTIRRQQSDGKGYYRKQSRMASSSLLWPSREDCPKCWQSLTDDTGLVMNMDSYDKEELFNHLKKTYWPDGIHNNRLVVLDRWSKSKRALSMKRLRARMAAHSWAFSALVLHVLVACLLMRILFPRCWKLHRRAVHGKNYKKKKAHIECNYLDERYSSPIQTNQNRHRRSMHTSNRLIVKNYTSEDRISDNHDQHYTKTMTGNLKSHIGRRRHSAYRPKKHNFNYFEL
ncbi:hypothetical protein ACHAWF_011627 [Thalassiosira exigua]